VYVEGADLEGRASREGARIAGAALHEGYWVDVEAVRDELAGLEALRRQLLSGGRAAAGARLARALSTRGLLVDAREGEPTKRGRRERVATEHPLGEARRIRLAALAARAEPGGELLGHASLEELVQLTCLHEEGHLVDRMRFLPLGRDVPGMLATLLRTGPSPRRIMEELEERAQLVALCEAPEPRFALAQVVDALEGGEGVHAAGYRRLARELVEQLAQILEEDPRTFPRVDPARTLLHQLHRLGPEEVRRLGLALASRRGLVR
jgi:hypothetical protein